MAHKAELETIVRTQFPLIFSMQDPVEAGAYIAKRDAAIDYAISVSGAPLTAETIRYQSILLYSSLIFLSFGFLNVSSVKIGDSTIGLDSKALLFYIAFLVGVAAVFVFKSYVDYDRSTFSRGKNIETIAQLKYIIQIGQLGERIEHYYWDRLNRAITDAYRIYNAKVMEAIDSVPSAIPNIQLITLDIEELRKIPELTGAIERHERWFGETKLMLDKDLERLVEAADQALLEDKLAAQNASAPYMIESAAHQKIQGAYSETLKPWIDMRSDLSSLNVRAVFERVSVNFTNGKLSALKDLLQKVLRIRRMYLFLEVVMPVLFALFAIIAVWHQVNDRGLPTVMSRALLDSSIKP